MEDYGALSAEATNALLSQLNREISTLKEEAERLRESLGVNYRLVTRLEVMLKDMIENEDMDTGTAEQIADIFGITLTKTIKGTVTVTWSFSAEVGLDESVDDLDFSAELVANGADDSDISEESFDVDED